MPKPKVVVILGAGSSVDFGVPPLKGLFKEKHARRQLNNDEFLRNRVAEWFWTPRGHALESSDESLTVEEILTILRDWENEEAECGHAPSHEECNRFRKGLYILIKAAIFDGKNTRHEHLNPLLNVARKHFDNTTWVTFNWDCIFESTYWYSQTNFGAGSRSNPTLVLPLKDWWNGSTKHTLLKLHGGINWWKIGGQLTYLPWSAGGSLSARWAEFQDAEHAPDDGPVILEPSAYKYSDPNYKLLEPQWRFFLERLCEANYVIVVGYSLPENDMQARSRISVAAQVNQNCRWLVIDPSPDICARYRRLLGTKVVTTKITTLSGFNNDIEDNLNEAFPELTFDAVSA
jgi:hypothetical protein